MGAVVALTVAYAPRPSHGQRLLTAARFALDDAGFATSKIAIANHGNDRASYTVSVTYTTISGNQQIGTGTAIVNDLDAGQSAIPQDANSLATAPGPYTCKIRQSLGSDQRGTGLGQLACAARSAAHCAVATG